MLELPDLTPEHFEILVMRELRKVGLEISELRIHRRTMLPEPDEGYLLEVKGVVRAAGWQRRVLIACRRQQRPIVAAEVELLKDHVKEADAEGGLLFGAADFEPDALTTAEDTALALLRNERPAILVQRFDGPTGDTAVQAGLWASKQLGRR